MTFECRCKRLSVDGFGAVLILSGIWKNEDRLAVCSWTASCENVSPCLLWTVCLKSHSDTCEYWKKCVKRQDNISPPCVNWYKFCICLRRLKVYFGMAEATGLRIMATNSRSAMHSKYMRRLKESSEKSTRSVQPEQPADWWQSYTSTGRSYVLTK